MELIESIKKAEEEALLLRENARKEAHAVSLEAEKTATQEAENKINAARKAAEKTVSDAKTEAGGKAQLILSSAESDCDAIRKKAGENQKTALDYVLSIIQ